MADTLRIKRRLVGGAAGPPASLISSEIAFNEQDRTLYYGMNNGGGVTTNVIPIAGSGAFLPITGGTINGALRISAADNVLGLLINGATRGVRFTTNSSGTVIEGVDATGVGTYQPLWLGGSVINFNAPVTVSTNQPFTLGRDPAGDMEAVTRQYLQANMFSITTGDARWVNIDGDAMAGGLGFGGATASSAVDLSRHIKLFDGGPSNSFGFNVSYDGARAHLNYVVTETTHTDHTFMVGNTQVAWLNSSGLGMGINTDIYLARDPTQNMHAVTKVYSDRNKTTGYFDLTSRTVVATNDQSDYSNFYLYGTPTAPSSLTMATPAGGRLIWNFNNATSQPVSVKAPGGGAFMVLPPSGTAYLLTDSVNVNFANQIGLTRPVADNTTFLATTEFVTRAANAIGGAYLATAGGTMNGTLHTNSGIDFNNAVSTPQDMARGITLFGNPINGYGFVVSNSTLNYNTMGGAKHDFYSENRLLLRINDGDAVRSSLPIFAKNYIQIDAQAGGTGFLNIVGGGAANTGIYTYNNHAGVLNLRWLITMASNDEGSDTTGTTGSAFSVHAYGNDGHYVGNPFYILRAEGRGGDASFSGYVYVAMDPWQPTSVVTLRYLEARYMPLTGSGFLPTAGGVMSGGISFGTMTEAGGTHTDISKHIILHTNGYGFGVTGDSRLNYNVDGPGTHAFIVGGTDRMTISATGATFNTVITVAPAVVVRNGTPNFQILPNLGGGSYNGIVQTGDIVLLAAGGAPDANTLTLVPWSNTLLGIRIDGAAHTLGLWAGSGVTVNASLYLAHDPPTAGNEAVTKNYVDSNTVTLAVGDTRWVNVGGDAMTGALTIGTPTVNATLTVNGDITANKWLIAGYNTNQTPPVAGVGYLSWNRTQGQGEVNFYNGYNSSGNSFDFRQVTGPGTEKYIAALTSAGTLWLAGNGINYNALGPNRIGFLWSGTALRAYIDGTNQGDLAFQSWVSANFAASGNYVVKSGDSMSGGLLIDYTPTNTSSQLWLRPANGNAGTANIRFSGTFGVGVPDFVPRYVASIRSGFVTGGWGQEYLDIWIGNTTNDANLDTNQARVARFMANGLAVTGGITASGTVLGQEIGSVSGKFTIANNPAYYMERQSSTGTWRWVDNNNLMFSIDNGGNAVAVGGLTVGGGINFGARTSDTDGFSGPTDLRRHIALWGSSYGFSVTSGTLNLVSGSTLAFYTGTTRTAHFDSTGLIFDTLGASIQLNNAGSNSISNGGDGASATVNNLRISSWWGVGFYNNVASGAVPQGQAGIYFNCRDGVGYFRQIILDHDPATDMEAATRRWVLANGSTGVANIAALRAMNSTTPYVYVHGYWTARDGGGGDYIRGAAGTDNGGSIIVTANGTYYLQSYGQSVSVRQFGAKGTGTDDDRVACQNALNASLDVLFPANPDGTAATYRLSGTLYPRVGHTIRGAGSGLVTLLSVFADFTFWIGTTGTAKFANFTLSDLCIKGGVHNVSGIATILYGNITIKNIIFTGVEALCVYINGGYNSLVDNCVSNPTFDTLFKAGRYEATSTDNNNYCFNPHFRDCRVQTGEVESGIAYTPGATSPCIRFRRVISGIIQNFVGSRLNWPQRGGINGDQNPITPVTCIQLENDCQGCKIIGGVTTGPMYGVMMYAGSGPNIGPNFTVIDNFDIDYYFAVGIWYPIPDGALSVDNIIKNCLITATNNNGQAINATNMLRFIIEGNHLDNYFADQKQGNAILLSKSNMVNISGNVINNWTTALGLVPKGAGPIGCVNIKFDNNTLYDNTNAITGDITGVDTGTNSYRDNNGINNWDIPFTTPAVPNAGVFVTNTTGRDCVIYLTGGNNVAPFINLIATGMTFAPGGGEPRSGSVVLPHGGNIGFTYVSPPTWVWSPI